MTEQLQDRRAELAEALKNCGYKPGGLKPGSPEWLEREKAKTQRDADYKNSIPGKLNQDDGVDCPICLNRGYVYSITEDGLDLVAHRCKCMEKRRIVENARRSGLGLLIHKKLDDYRAEEDWQKAVKATAVDYIKNPSGWFVALGQPGSGKTLICGIVASYLLRKGRIVELKSWPELVRESGTGWFKDRDTLRRYKEVEVLFIDDFLKQGTDNRSMQMAYEILNYRYNYRMPTIISGEKRIPEMWQLDEALASRMVEMSGAHLLDMGENPERNKRL